MESGFERNGSFSNEVVSRPLIDEVLAENVSEELLYSNLGIAAAVGIRHGLIKSARTLTCRFPLSDKLLVPTNRRSGGFPTLNSDSEANRGLRKKQYEPGYRGNVFLY